MWNVIELLDGFFFQAEDGIRDGRVTGVQTCALPISVAQGLAGGNNIVIVSTAGIIAGTFAGDRALATVPASTMIVGMWIGTLPVGYLAKRYGRRTAYLVGAFFGGLAGLTLAAAAWLGSFPLL